MNFTELYQLIYISLLQISFVAQPIAFEMTTQSPKTESRTLKK